MRLFSCFYGYAAVCVAQSNPFFADLLAQYMAFRRDRLLSSLDGKSVVFCNVEGAR